MILYVRAETDAMGHSSVDSLYVSPQSVKAGVNVSLLLPSSYHEFVRPIWVKESDDGNAVELSGAYGTAVIDKDQGGFWNSPTIGLSYARCEIAIRFIPLFEPTWDILTVRHMGVTEVLQREEVTVGTDLATLRPRTDGSLMEWMRATVTSVSNNAVTLRAPAHLRVELGAEPANGADATFELRSFSTIINEWDEANGRPLQLTVDTQDITDSLTDADAALRVAESIAEQVPEELEIIAQYMGYAADLGQADAEAWLRDYYEVDDTRHHPYV